MKQIFESDNIRYAEVSEDFLRDYLIMVNDAEHVAGFIGMTEPVSEEKERDFIRKKLEENAPIFSMIDKKSGGFIGNIELMDVEDDAGELGIAITAGMQDMGYGTEAIRAIIEYGFEQMGLKRIFLKVYPNNFRAIHVYRK
ncbi:MAG: GNAT family N-acetyltransferase, partial [Lachnospiraceae bacterium]|nr:GNAT family N-acetyltransferase [Lachnospiraceae bacterium]